MNLMCILPVHDFILLLYMPVCAHLLSHVQLFGTLWTIARQPPLSMGLSRQEY